MAWPIVNADTEPNDLELVTVVSSSPLVLIKGHADPGTPQGSPYWKIWRETYDTNGLRIKVEFMNKSRKRDQIYADIQASGTTWS